MARGAARRYRGTVGFCIGVMRVVFSATDRLRTIGQRVKRRLFELSAAVRGYLFGEVGTQRCGVPAPCRHGTRGWLRVFPTAARGYLFSPNVSYWFPPDGWNRLPAYSGRQLADQTWTGPCSDEAMRSEKLDVVLPPGRLPVPPNTFVCGAPAAARKQGALGDVLRCFRLPTRCGWVFNHSRAPHGESGSQNRHG